MNHTNLATSLSLLLCLGSCATTDPAFFSRDGRPLEKLDPVPYRIAIAPIELETGSMRSSSPSDLKFLYDPPRFQKKLVDALTELNTSVEVVEASSSDLEGPPSEKQRWDLLVRPRLTSPAVLRHEGTSGSWLVSGLLWVTTWIGGLFVSDSSYEAKLALDYKIEIPGGREIGLCRGQSTKMDLGFWDRNEGISGGFFQTWILPPFWTSDDSEVTSKNLSEAMTRRVAADLTKYLKEGFQGPEEEFLARLVLKQPRIGSKVGDSVTLDGELVARWDIEQLKVFLNDGVEPIDIGKLSPIDQQKQADGKYKQKLKAVIRNLEKGKNHIIIEVRTNNRVSTKTIEVIRS
ncbi:MAG: hypothetical protein ACE5F1_01305 [Planctomycetota bacterium]